VYIKALPGGAKKRGGNGDGERERGTSYMDDMDDNIPANVEARNPTRGTSGRAFDRGRATRP
jgi:hypothetical protein